MKIELRRWNMGDANDLVLHANNYQIAKFLTDGFPHPYTMEHAHRFIETVGVENPQKVFAIVIDDKPVGAIGVFPQQDIMRLNAEMGYWIAEDFWGRGIVSKVIPIVVEYAFSTFEIKRIYARPFGNNMASQRVLEKSGFILEARIQKNIIKFGEVLDELIYACRRD
ncbi:MAG: GNAT family N-acetyltransferase [Flavobacteriales bacterium]|nr:GNAT family N-acetyltransferase [Flavobacteriales bacterium]